MVWEMSHHRLTVRWMGLRSRKWCGRCLTIVSLCVGWDCGAENCAVGLSSSSHCAAHGTAAKIEGADVRVDRAGLAVAFAGRGPGGRLSGIGAACLSRTEPERALPELGSNGRPCKRVPAAVS